jgi:hypothetical protein
VSPRRGELEEAFITCRTLRHSWDAIPTGERRPKFGTLVTLRCTRCGTLRYDKFSRITGERISTPQYVHPDGYRDADRHPMSWWRASWAETVYELGLTVDAE